MFFSSPYTKQLIIVNLDLLAWNIINLLNEFVSLWIKISMMIGKENHWYYFVFSWMYVQVVGYKLVMMQYFLKNNNHLKNSKSAL